MKLISPKMLEKMRRGAERLYIKHRESLATATVVIRPEIGKELGLNVPEVKPVETTASTSEPIGLFADEAGAKKVVREQFVRVKVKDYIEALQKVSQSGAAEKTDASTKK